MPLIFILMEDCLPFTFLEDVNAPFLTLLFVKNSKRENSTLSKNVFQDNLPEMVFKKKKKKKEEYMVLQMKSGHWTCSL